jgi:hypothetical protein
VILEREPLRGHEVTRRTVGASRYRRCNASSDMPNFFRRVAACVALIGLPACASTTGEAIDFSEQALATYPVLEAVDRPAGAPFAWGQPASEGYFGQYGYCGATAAANLLRWYDREVSPESAIADGCWSAIGTFPSDMSAYLRKHHASLDCYYQAMWLTSDALAGLRDALAVGRPVIIMYMTDALNAHWVTVTGVHGTNDDPDIIVMSYGAYWKLRWSALKSAWRNAYGGPYPYVMCNASSPHAASLESGR